MLNEYMKHFRGALTSLFTEQFCKYAYCPQLFVMILCKKLKLHAYKLQLVQKVTCEDQDSRKQLTLDLFSGIKEDKMYLNVSCFSDETTFHVCGTVNRHNCHIEHDSPKVSVWCAIMKTVFGLFFFEEHMVTGDTFLLYWRTLLCFMFMWEQFSS
jgi:hypothetical protein